MTHIRKMADVVSCLVKAPRTVPELCDVTGISPDCARRYLSALTDEGIVEAKRLPRPKTKGGNSPILYRWAA